LISASLLNFEIVEKKIWISYLYELGTSVYKKISVLLIAAEEREKEKHLLRPLAKTME
jgi:hypothetical protein